MNFNSDNGLYEDRFLLIMSLMNSATVSLIIGVTISLGLVIFVHWILGAVVAFLTAIAAIGSYFVFGK